MNRNSYSIFQKSGFIDLGKMPRYVKILDLEAVLFLYGVPRFFARITQAIFRAAWKIYLKVRLTKKPGDLRIQEVAGLDYEFGKFWDSISTHYNCISKRSTEFLRWRYVDQPLWEYTILKGERSGAIRGFVVLRKGRVKSGRLKGHPIGIISDILVHPDDRGALRWLLAEAVKFFREKRTLIVKCDILDAKIEKGLSGAGFVKVSSDHRFMLNIYENGMPREDIDLARMRKNWFINSGDSDFDFD
ncbi:MAG: hypothetical protein NG740_05935 [Omnitrophica bacterium]|nr:hypothetical protein [Candidatus Omnitrophota bacterium]